MISMNIEEGVGRFEKLSDSQIENILVRVHNAIVRHGLKSSNASVLCRISQIQGLSGLSKRLLTDCYTSARMFIYTDMLHSSDSDYEDTLSEAFARTYYTTVKGFTLTKFQHEIVNSFDKHRRVAISAPTSFGKSAIVPELIRRHDYGNIAIIVPTISLLTEYISRFGPLRFRKSYNIVYTSSQSISTNNIFIVTPERMDMILDKHNELTIDFFVMDEIYKIANNDERSTVFMNCLYRLSNMNADMYLIGPYFEKFSKTFRQRYGVKFIKYNQEIVAKNEYDLSTLASKDSLIINEMHLKWTKLQQNNLTKIIPCLRGQSMIYVGKTRTAETVAKVISQKVSCESGRCDDFVKFISETIAPDWSLCLCLKKGTAFHHASMPKYIQREIVDNFNMGNIDTVVCTPTLIEGVNTSAKNVLILDNYKGDTQLTGFDIKNIKGRSGRLGQHFVGNVFKLTTLPVEKSLATVEFSLFDESNLTDEQNILIKKRDLTDEQTTHRDSIVAKCKSAGIPIKLVMSNRYINVDRQLALARHMSANKQLLEELYFDSNLPQKPILKGIVRLCFEYLFPQRYQDNRELTSARISGLTAYYVYRQPSVKELINSWDATSVNTKIRNVFKLISTYFEYLLPKCITCYATIYNHYSKMAIDVSYILNRLEHGFEGQNEILLKEAGMPPTIIKKISKYTSGAITIRDIQRSLKGVNFDQSEISSYEANIIKKVVFGVK